MKASTHRTYKSHIAVLMLLATAYLWMYFHHPAVPGASPAFPLGWWGWFDQSEYLKGAQAFARLDFSSGNFFYPPLYSLLGTMFVRAFPLHPFLPLNLAAFLAFAHFFVSFARRYIGGPASLAVFLVSFYPGGDLIDIWLEPWTTTLTAPLFAILLWDLDRHSARAALPSPWRTALWGGIGGAVFLTRPFDAVVLSPLYAFLCLWLWCQCGDVRRCRRWVPFLQRAAVLVACGAAGVGLFLAFNILVHGSLVGRYFGVAAQANGVPFGDLPEKAVSILMDPQPLYGDAEVAVFTRVKWLALGVPALLFALWRGPLVVRLVAGLVVVHCALYLPYSDLLPTGIWAYHNIHYFKWTLPYVAFLIAWSGPRILNPSPRPWAAMVICSTVSIAFLCIHIELVSVDGFLPANGGNTVDSTRIELVRTTPTLIDKISFPTLNGNYHASYLGRANRIWSDSHELLFVRDYRLLPAQTGVDLLFVRPVLSQNIAFEPHGLVFDAGEVGFRASTYRFAWGLPRWLRPAARFGRSGEIDPLGPRYGATLAEGINFRRQGYPRFLAKVEGVSGYENWGHWSDTESEGTIRFTFVDELPSNFTLQLTSGAFGPNIGGLVQVRVGTQQAQFRVEDAQTRTYKLDFTNVRGAKTIELTVPHPVRPMDIIPASTDARRLGIALVSLRILDID